MPYIVSSIHGSIFHSAVPQEFRHNVWILAIGNNAPITAEQAKKDITSHQQPNAVSAPVNMVIAKRCSRPPPTTLQNDWAAFQQFRIVPHHIVDSSAIVVEPSHNQDHSIPPEKPNLSSVQTTPDSVMPKSTPASVIGLPLPTLTQVPHTPPTPAPPLSVPVQIHDQPRPQNPVSVHTPRPTSVQDNDSTQMQLFSPEPNPSPRRSIRIATNNTQQKDTSPKPIAPTRRSTRQTRQSQLCTYPSKRHLSSKYGLASDHLLRQAIARRIVNLPQRPECPPHIGAALKSPLRQLWIDCLYDAYDKMHHTGTLSLPFPQSLLPPGTSVLRPRVTCEIKITDSTDYYEAKCCLCADGSRMVLGIDYDISYAPVIESDALLLMIAVASSRKLTFYFLDISNAFQSNVIHDPAKRHYMHTPSMYLQWFRLRFPNHPLSRKHDSTSVKYVMQTLRGIQGTKDAGHEWYKLLASIFTKILHMVPSVSNKGLFYWKHDQHYAYIALATDDILMASSHVSLFQLLQKTFDQYFGYTTATGSLLHFLNYRIIQSPHGVSIDQYSHLRQTILNEFFPSTSEVPFQSSPFPLSPAFEMELYQATPLPDDDLQALTIKYNGAYNHWTGALLHIATKSRSDLSYLAMRLSGYNNVPNQASYKALYQGMCYSYHHPLIPIMFSSHPVEDIAPMKSHFAKGKAEITNFDYSQHTGLESWSDADFCRDVLNRRSTTSAEHTYNSVSFAWTCTKQTEPGGSVNEAETRSLFQATRRTIWYRNILQSLNVPQAHPTPTFEDNQATITQVLNDRLTPRVRHIDVLVAWLNEQFSRERITPVSCDTSDNVADKNSKPHGGRTLQEKHMTNVRFYFYPPPGSEHHRLLQLDLFDIGTHRGSFLKDGKLPPL